MQDWIWEPVPSMPHASTEAIVEVPQGMADAASVGVLPPPHEDKIRTARGMRASRLAPQSLIILIIFVPPGRTSQRRVVGVMRPLLRQPRNAVLNVIDTDAKSNTYTLFVDARA